MQMRLWRQNKRIWKRESVLDKLNTKRRNITQYYLTIVMSFQGPNIFYACKILIKIFEVKRPVFITFPFRVHSGNYVILRNSQFLNKSTNNNNMLLLSNSQASPGLSVLTQVGWLLKYDKFYCRLDEYVFLIEVNRQTSL